MFEVAAEIPPLYILGLFLAVLLTGFALGSFASALIYRVPRKISWIKADSGKKSDMARSACPACGHKLAPKDLIPLFSWIFLKGKCRYCHASIGKRYPLVELTVLVACLLIFAVQGLSLPAIFLMLSIPFWVALLVIDLDHMILPDQLVLVSAVLALLYQGFYAFDIGVGFLWPIEVGISAMVYGGLAWGLSAGGRFLLKKEVMGFGDVKFFAVAGLWLGVETLPLYLILSGVCGVLFGFVWRKMTGNERFPFGPALILSLYGCSVLYI